MQAEINDMNAGLSDMQAADAIARGNFRAAQRETAGFRRAQAHKTKMSASGVAVNSGSPLDVMMGIELVASADAEMERENAGREAFGHDIQAMNYRNNSIIQRDTASQINPLLRGVTAGVSTAAMVNPGLFKPSSGATTTGGTE